MSKLAIVLLLAAICALAWPSNAQEICPKPCTHILDPVCGTTDGRSFRYFGSRCHMDAYNECDRGSERQMHEVDLSNCDEPELE